MFSTWLVVIAAATSEEKVPIRAPGHEAAPLVRLCSELANSCWQRHVVDQPGVIGVRILGLMSCGCFHLCGLLWPPAS